MMQQLYLPERALILAPRFADAQSTLGLLLFQGNLDAKAARKPFDLSRTLGEGEAPVMAPFCPIRRIHRTRWRCGVGCGAGVADRSVECAHPSHCRNRPFCSTPLSRSHRAFRQTLSINPEIPDCHSRIGMVLLAQNKAGEALKAFEADSHKWSKLSGVAIAHNRLRNAAAAKAAMAALVSDTDTVSLYQQGHVLAQWAIRTLPSEHCNWPINSAMRAHFGALRSYARSAAQRPYLYFVAKIHGFGLVCQLL